LTYCARGILYRFPCIQSTMAACQRLVLQCWTSATKIATKAKPVSSMLGHRIFTLGNGIGSDTSIIAANNRCYSSACTPTTTPSSSIVGKGNTDPSMIAANNRCSTFKSLGVKQHHQQLKYYSSTAAALQAEKEMRDEYGDMNSEGHTYHHHGKFTLENGQSLRNVQLRYQTYGTLSESRDNVIVICHALTGNASLHSWWGDLLGPTMTFDTDKYFVVCCNVLGSCYGSTSPQSVKASNDLENQEEETSYGLDFPDVSVQDTVRIQLEMLQKELQINSVKCVIGGSFGGMQAIEFAVQGGSTEAPFTTADGYPMVRSVVPIACGAAHTAWQIAISEVQRQAIYADPNWKTQPEKAFAGLSVARQMGMVSYRTAMGYESKFGRHMQIDKEANDDDANVNAGAREPAPYGTHAKWQVKSYLEYQGRKFLGRFDPITYVKLTEQMDSHDVGRNRGGIVKALDSVTIPALVLGIDSDVLYPLSEQEQMASMLPNGHLEIIHSDDGHDGFLLEQDQVASHITKFLEAHD